MTDRKLSRLATILILSPFIVFILAFASAVLFVHESSPNRALNLLDQTFYLATAIGFLLFSSGLTLGVYLRTHSIPKAVLVLFVFLLIIALGIYDLILRLLAS